MDKEYKYEIMDAIISMQNVEGILFGINIPNPSYRFMRWPEYPYSSKLYKIEGEPYHEYYARLMNLRIIPYLYDFKITNRGDGYD